jgi:predicted nucleotidyltransferase
VEFFGVTKIVAVIIRRFFILKIGNRLKQEITPTTTVTEVHHHYHIYAGASMRNTTINNSGSMGLVNTGEISHVQNIEVNIGKLKESDAPVAEAFSTLKAAINYSKLI